MKLLVSVFKHTSGTQIKKGFRKLLFLLKTNKYFKDESVTERPSRHTLIKIMKHYFLRLVSV